MGNNLNKFAKLLLLLVLSISVAACGKKSASGDANIEGVSQYKFAIANGAATLSVVFDSMKLDAGARIPLQTPAGAFIELTPDFASGGTLFVISTPLTSLFSGTNGLPFVGLPDGRVLPGVLSGTLAATAVNLPIFGLTYLYMGADVFGIFVPLALPNVPVMVSTKMRDERGNIIGAIYGIPKGSKGTISGVLFLFPIEGSGAASFMQNSLR